MPPASPRRPLRFREDGTFTIAQFTDVHWRNGDEADQRSRALLEQVLDAERPDLAVLTGDIVEGSEAADPGEAYRQVVVPLEGRAVPWASVFGNHDDEGALSRRELLEVQQSCSFCLTEGGPAGLTGVGNYVLRILGAQSEALAAALYLLDSHPPSGVLRGVGARGLPRAPA